MTNPAVGSAKIGVGFENGEDVYNNHTASQYHEFLYKNLGKGLFVKYMNTNKSDCVQYITLYDMPQKK